MSYLHPEDIDALRLAVVRLERKLRKAAGPGDLTPSQFSALYSVDRHGPFSLGELARREQVGKSTVTRLVATLERAGLIERAVGRSDARSTTVAITSEGRSLLARRADASNGYLEARLAALDTGQRVRIVDALGALSQLAERS